MPVEFLTDDQAAAFGRFAGPPSRAELERWFFLDDEDRKQIVRHRRDDNRLGFALQLTTVRFLGTFLPNPLEVPAAVVGPGRRWPPVHRQGFREGHQPPSARSS